MFKERSHCIIKKKAIAFFLMLYCAALNLQHLHRHSTELNSS